MRPPPCEVKDPHAVVVTATATPIIKALEARKWTIWSADPDCRGRFVDVIVWMSRPPGGGWPAFSKLDVRIAIDTTAPTPTVKWNEAATTLVGNLDRLWAIPVVKRFRDVVGVEYVSVWFRTGPEVPMSDPSRGSVTVDLASRSTKTGTSIEGGSGLRVVLTGKDQIVERLWSQDRAIIATLDTLVPGFTAACPSDGVRTVLNYDGRKHVATTSLDARCPTCGPRFECSLLDRQKQPWRLAPRD